MNLVKREAVYHSPPSPFPTGSDSSSPPPPAEDLTRLRQLAEIATSRAHILAAEISTSRSHLAEIATSRSHLAEISTSRGHLAEIATSRGNNLADIAASREILLSSLLYPASVSPASSHSSASSPPPQDSPIDLRVAKCRRLDYSWAAVQERRDSLDSNR